MDLDAAIIAQTRAKANEALPSRFHPGLGLSEAMTDIEQRARAHLLGDASECDFQAVVAEGHQWMAAVRLISPEAWGKKRSSQPFSASVVLTSGKWES